MTTEYDMIEKFNGENQHIWKLKIKFILVEKGLWKIVSRRVLKPFGLGVTPEDVEKWEDLDERALSSICLHMKDSQLFNVSKAESFAETWQSLDTVRAQKCGKSTISFAAILYHQNAGRRQQCGPHQQSLGTCRATCINREKGFRSLDDYDIVGESSGIILNIGSDIEDQGAQCFDDGDGNCTITTRRIAP